MDDSTDSDSNEDVSVQSENHDIHVKDVPAFVAWQDPCGENQSLTDLGLDLVYDAGAKKALVRLRASTKLKKGSAKPSIFLFIKPAQIQTITCVSNEEDLDEGGEEQHRQAREKLNTSTFALRFELRCPANFVVPNEYPLKFFRAGSQAVWKSWKAFANGALRFVVHFPMRSLPKSRLVLFCHTASRREALLSFDDDLNSLYGGKGGRVVDPHVDEDNAGAEVETKNLVDEDTAPPAYKERMAAGPSISSISPPLYLSPKPEPSNDRKRRRRGSSEELDDAFTTYGKGNNAHGMILQCLARLQKTIDQGREAQGTILAKLLVKVERIEDRIGRLEDQQQSLVQEVEAQVEPLWDELGARLQSQEDREHDYIRDIVDDIFDQKIDEKMEEKIPEAVDQYLNDEEGQIIINDVVGDRVHEETRDFLRRQHFTGHFSITESN